MHFCKANDSTDSKPTDDQQSQGITRLKTKSPAGETEDAHSKQVLSQLMAGIQKGAEVCHVS